MLVLTIAKSLASLLVFALPQSPMSQPWAVIAGNTLSMLAGISVIHLVDQPLLAMPLAASLSILGMFVLRCLHPLAAAVAMIVVLGYVMHYRYAFSPVMVDSILLIMAEAVFSNLTGKHYPNDQIKHLR
jgi:CBS domain-containing membrane protein